MSLTDRWWPGFSNIIAAEFEPRYDTIPVGRVSGMKVKYLDSGLWYYAVVYYDNKGREIQTFSENHLSGIDRVSVSYNDHTGEVLSTLKWFLLNERVYNFQFVFNHLVMLHIFTVKGCAIA